jgi:hypothetical protein
LDQELYGVSSLYMSVFRPQAESLE